MKKQTIIILILWILFLLILSMFNTYNNNKYRTNQKLIITQACEDGCVMSQGLNYDQEELSNDSIINSIIFTCIFKCNDKYFYSD